MWVIGEWPVAIERDGLPRTDPSTMWTHAHAYTHRVRTHAHVYAFMRTSMHGWTDACTHAWTHACACTHARMHVCTYASLDRRMHTGGSERTDVGDGGRTRWIGDTLAGEHPIAVPTHPSVHACTRTTAEWRTLAHRRLTIAGLGLM